jgi:hypothetical protein
MDSNMENETTSSAAVRGECLCMGAGPQATAVLKSISLGPATEHFRNSRIEFLKGLRTLLDSRIEKLQKRAQTKGTSVPVD